MIIMPINSWSSYKSTVLTQKQLSLQYCEYSDKYEIYAEENKVFIWTICLLKDGGSDVANFENSYKSTSNKKIINQDNSPFSAKTLPNGKKIYKRIHGVSAAISGNIDFIIPYNSCKITAIEIINGGIGDKVCFKVYDTPQGTYSGQADALLNQFGYVVYVNNGFYKHDSNYDADLYLNMKLRMEFDAILPKTIYVNLILHEIV